jgi:hypothetical protein
VGLLIWYANILEEAAHVGAHLVSPPSLGPRAGVPPLAVLTNAMLLAAMGFLARRFHGR